MWLRWTIGITCAVIVAITIARGVRGAELQSTGWQLQRALPGEEFRPRGRFFPSRTGCLLDLASDAIVQPAGTRLACIRIISTKGRTR